MLKDLLRDLPKSHVHLGAFLLRLGLAAIFIFHGYLKLVQENGANWHEELSVGTQVAVAWGEFGGGLALLFGLFSRLVAIGFTIIQIGAITLHTGQYDFINIGYRKGNPSAIPTGSEYNFALIVMCLAVVAIGSGKVSLDYLLFGRREETLPASPAMPSRPVETVTRL
jgi:putative oxidoreductase